MDGGQAFQEVRDTSQFDESAFADSSATAPIQHQAARQPDAVSAALPASSPGEEAKSAAAPEQPLHSGIASVLPLARSALETLPATASVAAGATTADLAVVDLSDRRVYLYRNDEILADYSIAVGRTHWETPTGEFRVIEKQENPVWRHPFTRELVMPGADNPLGTHWVGFWSNGTHQIGFHGTNQVDAIGQAISHGCIRMQNADVQTLYALLPMGSAVTVRQ